MIDDVFEFEREVTVPSVTQLMEQFPNLPPQALLSLAVLTVLQRTVTPQRVCGCGCGEAVTGKAKFASPACRKRLERERRALRVGSAKNLNFALQYEIPVPIPSVPVEKKLEIVGNDFPFRHFVDGQELPASDSQQTNFPI
jgi:predicted nucleic acid-binding Zn ribbon protein